MENCQSNCEVRESTIKGDNKEINKNFSESKKKKKQKIIYIIFLISVIILVLTIVFLLIFFLLIKKKKNIKESFIINETNSIEATYITEAGKEILLINQNEIGLKDDDYYIEEINFPQNRNYLRNLKLLSINNGRYLPKTSGILNTRIFLKKTLKSLDGFFKDNKELIKVNLTNLIMNEVTSMKSTFSGCSNLKEINLEGINSGNLMKMENTFENCIELKNINLSPLNTSNLLYMNNMFSG